MIVRLRLARITALDTACIELTCSLVKIIIQIHSVSYRADKSVLSTNVCERPDVTIITPTRRYSCLKEREQSKYWTTWYLCKPCCTLCDCAMSFTTILSEHCMLVKLDKTISLPFSHPFTCPNQTRPDRLAWLWFKNIQQPAATYSKLDKGKEKICMNEHKAW